MADLEQVRKYQPEPELALIVALNTWVQSVLTNEWFHADVHAGNLLMLTDGRVAFIDFKLEATRTEQFAQFLSRSPELAGLVTVPAVYRQASATRVLTLQRLYGVSMTDLETVRRYASSPEVAVITALNTW